MSRNVGGPLTRPFQLLPRLKTEEFVKGDLDAVHENVEKQLRSLSDRESSRLQIDGWYEENMPTTVGDTALLRLGITTVVPTAWVVVRPSSVTSYWAKISAIPGGGTATVKVFKNGGEIKIASGIAFTSASASTFAVASQAAGLAVVAPGDLLEIMIATSSLNPVTLDLRAGLELSDS